MYSTSNSPVVKHCEQCGAEFTPHPFVGKRQRFCSDACRIAAQTQRYRAPIVCTCRHCGKEFQPKKIDRDQYCSRECAFAYRQLHGFPERRKPKRETIPLPTCEICGKPCKRKGAKTCSDECRKEHERRKSREWFESRSQRDRSPRPCKECGAMFVPEYGNKRRLFCSEECQSKQAKRIGKATRKARIRHASSVESVDPLMVFRRDGWRCKLCGCRTPKRLRGTTDERAPELDHVVPLALGGDHSYANTQCLCRKCNQSKGASVAGQLSLV